MKKQLLLFLLIASFHTLAIAQVQQGTLLSQWAVDTLVGSRSYDNTYNEVWGLVQGGKEYAVIGSTYGTHFIDVTDPTASVEVTAVKGGTSSSEIIHRDFHDFRGYLYAVADEGVNSTLQIMDYSYLPDSVHIVYDSKLAIRRSHNIFIDTARARLYSCISAGDTLNFSPLRIFDIEDPEDPQLLGSYFRFDGYRISQVHDIYVDQDTAFMNCGPDGLVIAEFSDPENPTTFSILDPTAYPDAGYNHSGYLTKDRKHYIMADEDWGYDVKIFNVEDLTNPELVTLLNADSDSEFSIAHNQLVKDDFLYCSYYYDGLQVFDIKNAENPQRVMEFKTSNISHRRSYEGAWGVYPFLPSGNILISDMQEGLFVIAGIERVTSNESPAINNTDILLYPNPIKQNEVLTIRNLNSPLNDNTNIIILDSKGHQVYRTELKFEKIEIPELPDGIYSIIVGNSIKKLIIKN